MTEASDVLPPGTRLEEFEIERYLNAGGFGVTYLARDLSLDARRVVKEYLPREWATRRQDWTVGPRTDGNENYAWGLKHFLAEARMLARFRDPRIVHVYRVIEAWGTAYMVMEHVEGRTLRAEVEATGCCRSPVCGTCWTGCWPGCRWCTRRKCGIGTSSRRT